MHVNRLGFIIAKFKLKLHKKQQQQKHYYYYNYSASRQGNISYFPLLKLKN